MNFSVEEENLICMYHTSDRRRTMARMLAALPAYGHGNAGGWQTGYHCQSWKLYDRC